MKKPGRISKTFHAPQLPPVLRRIKDALLPVEITDDMDAIKREGQRRAAVLILLVKRREGWQVILTLRPETMSTHAGQISFPGGKVDMGESARQAALRETHEEIGVAPSDIKLLGRLPSFNAVSKFRVTPFVGLIDPHAQLIAEPGEVDDIFEVPLAFLMEPDNHVARDAFFDGRVHRLYDMPYEGVDGVKRNIWGMTAMMLYRLWQCAFADGLPFDRPYDRPYDR